MNQSCSFLDDYHHTRAAWLRAVTNSGKATAANAGIEFEIDLAERLARYGEAAAKYSLARNARQRLYDALLTICLKAAGTTETTKQALVDIFCTETVLADAIRDNCANPASNATKPAGTTTDPTAPKSHPATPDTRASGCAAGGPGGGLCRARRRHEAGDH